MIYEEDEDDDDDDDDDDDWWIFVVSMEGILMYFKIMDFCWWWLDCGLRTMLMGFFLLQIKQSWIQK